MAHKQEAIGINNAAYQVSQTNILEWLNDLLALRLSKIEELATGAVYCQLVDCLYPQSFAFSTVNWQAKYDYEYMANYRLLI